MSSDCNCPFLTANAKSLREEGFLHPTCPCRARTHTSVIYHHAITTCQLDNDFSPGVSRLEMLFRLQKQLHVFSFLRQRRPASMQMKGLKASQGCSHCSLLSTLTPCPCWWRKKLCPSEWCIMRCYDHHNLCLFWYQWFNSLTAWSYIKQFSSASKSAINYFPPFIFPPLPPLLDQNCPFHSSTSSWIKGEKGQNLLTQAHLSSEVLECCTIPGLNFFFFFFTLHNFLLFYIGKYYLCSL